MNLSDPIIKHYEECLTKNGDGHKAVDWPNEKDADKRYNVMFDLFKKPESCAPFLDFGCGVGGMYEWMTVRRYYTGYDASEKMIAKCKEKYPEGRWLTELDGTKYDYIIMNGVFTMKCSLTFEQAWINMTETLKEVWKIANVGVAFNVMSKNVTHERNDLFHVSLDMLTRWICDNLSRNFIVRNDYGLFEYTTYVYK